MKVSYPYVYDSSINQKLFHFCDKDRRDSSSEDWSVISNV